MAEPAPQPEPPAENSVVAAPRGKPFEKGKSGNPGGRPRGLARQVRESLPEEQAVAFGGAVMSGYLATRHPETGEVTHEKVDVRDRVAVWKVMLERGWGKPAEFVPIDDGDPLELSEEQAAAVAIDFEGRLDELDARRRVREERQTK